MDAQDIALKTIRLLRNPAQAAEMGAAGIRRIERLYREEQVTARYRALYGELLRRPAGRDGGETAPGQGSA